MPELKLAPEKPKRYQVIEGSQSCHCCFEYTVVDTHRPVMITGKHYNNQYEPMCECYNRTEADSICSALNGVHYGR